MRIKKWLIPEAARQEVVLEMYRPDRPPPSPIGYLLASPGGGHGVTIIAETEEEYENLNVG